MDGPDINALTMPISKSDLQLGEENTPLHINILRDLRNACERLASLGNLSDVATGSTLVWDNSSSTDLYKAGVYPKIQDFIGYTSKQYQWQRTLGEVAQDNGIREIDIVEVKLAAEYLARCAGVQPVSVVG